MNSADHFFVDLPEIDMDTPSVLPGREGKFQFKFPYKAPKKETEPIRETSGYSTKDIDLSEGFSEFFLEAQDT